MKPKTYKGVVRIVCGAATCLKGVTKDVLPSCAECTDAKVDILDLKGNTIITRRKKKPAVTKKEK